MATSLTAIFLSLLVVVKSQVNLTDILGKCHKNDPNFDNCIKDGLNNLRPYYETGLPESRITPFDPFFIPQVSQKRSGPFFNYKLILTNVTEAGWTISEVTKFKTDFKKNSVQYTQFFPDKRLDGWYEIDGTFLGNKVRNSGSWNLTLFDFVQTTTITRKPTRDASGNLMNNPPIKATISIETCKKLDLHIGHLAGGRTIVENMLDWIINTAWQPGFVVLKPVINDLVSTAFTEIFNKNFQNFPFDKIFPN